MFLTPSLILISLLGIVSFLTGLAFIRVKINKNVAEKYGKNGPIPIFRPQRRESEGAATQEEQPPAQPPTQPPQQQPPAQPQQPPAQPPTQPPQQQPPAQPQQPPAQPPEIKEVEFEKYTQYFSALTIKAEEKLRENEKLVSALKKRLDNVSKNYREKMKNLGDTSLDAINNTQEYIEKKATSGDGLIPKLREKVARAFAGKKKARLYGRNFYKEYEVAQELLKGVISDLETELNEIETAYKDIVELTKVFEANLKEHEVEYKLAKELYEKEKENYTELENRSKAIAKQGLNDISDLVKGSAEQMEIMEKQRYGMLNEVKKQLEETERAYNEVKEDLESLKIYKGRLENLKNEYKEKLEEYGEMLKKISKELTETKNYLERI